jgi:hypothetical protein
MDYPASKGGEFRVLRKGSIEWTCLLGPPPGSKHDDPGCFDRVFFEFVKEVLAGRPQHIDSQMRSRNREWVSRGRFALHERVPIVRAALSQTFLSNGRKARYAHGWSRATRLCERSDSLPYHQTLIRCALPPVPSQTNDIFENKAITFLPFGSGCSTSLPWTR